MFLLLFSEAKIKVP